VVYPPTGSRRKYKGDKHPPTLLMGYGTLYFFRSYRTQFTVP